MMVHFLALLLIVCFQSWNAVSFFFPSSNSNPKTDEAKISSLTSLSQLTGVPPDLIEKYSHNTYICDNGQKILTSKEINDDYCDCIDGSDEPGTNACAALGSTFYCENQGYKPISLLSSRVNDGICDCCDGSDETIGERATCYNTCIIMANKEKDMLKGLQSIFNEGYEIRSQLIHKIQSKLETESHDLDNVLNEIEKQSSLLQEYEFQQEKEKEQFKINEIEKEKTVLANLIHLTGIDLVTTQQLPFLLKVFMDVVQATEDEIRAVLVTTNGDEQVYSNSKTDSNNKNEQQEEGETPSDEQHQHVHDDDYDAYGNDVDHQHHHQSQDDSTIETTSTTINSSSHNKNCILLSATTANEAIDSRLKFMCDHIPDLDPTIATPEVLHAALYEVAQAIIFNFLQSRQCYLQTQWIFGYYRVHGHFNDAYHFTTALMHDDNIDNHNNAKNTCPSILSATHTDPQSLQQQPQQQTCNMASNLQDVIDLHDVFLKSQISSYTTHMQQLKSSLIELKSHRQVGEIAKSQLKSYENQLAFLALQNECVQVKDSHFTYKVCLLEKVTQHDDDGNHGEVLLGTFYSQIKEMSITSGGGSGMSVDSATGGKYTYNMKFKDGQNCHAFGSRSAEVHITCGKENKLLSAIEPSTCHYVLEMESPAACSERYARDNGLTILSSSSSKK